MPGSIDSSASKRKFFFFSKNGNKSTATVNTSATSIVPSSLLAFFKKSSSSQQSSTALIKDSTAATASWKELMLKNDANLLKSMSDVEIKRQETMYALFQTELRFSLSLGTTLDYRNAISEKNPKAILAIFLNIDKIAALNSAFVGKLMRTYEWSAAINGVGEPFFDHICKCQTAFTEYCSEFPENVLYLTSHSTMYNYVQNMKNGKIAGGNDLVELLDLPRQRLDDYKNILETLLTLTDEDHNDMYYLKRALAVIREVIDLIPKVASVKRSRAKLSSFLSSVDGADKSALIPAITPTSFSELVTKYKSVYDILFETNVNEIIFKAGSLSKISDDKIQLTVTKHHVIFTKLTNKRLLASSKQFKFVRALSRSGLEVRSIPDIHKGYSNLVEFRIHEADKKIVSSSTIYVQTMTPFARRSLVELLEVSPSAIPTNWLKFSASTDEFFARYFDDSCKFSVGKYLESTCVLALWKDGVWEKVGGDLKLEVFYDCVNQSHLLQISAGKIIVNISMNGTKFHPTSDTQVLMNGQTKNNESAPCLLTFQNNVDLCIFLEGIHSPPLCPDDLYYDEDAHDDSFTPTMKTEAGQTIKLIVSPVKLYYKQKMLDGAALILVSAKTIQFQLIESKSRNAKVSMKASLKAVKKTELSDNHLSLEFNDKSTAILIIKSADSASMFLKRAKEEIGKLIDQFVGVLSQISSTSLSLKPITLNVSHEKVAPTINITSDENDAITV